MSTTLELFDLDSKVMGQEVPTSVLLPAGFDPERSAGLPLVIFLHGGGGSRNQLAEQQHWIDGLLADGIFPPAVFVMFSSGPFSGYLGDWETFIARELPDYMSERFATRSDREGTVIVGISMGGYGALKSAFRSPDRFIAVGAMEPSLEPTLTKLPDYTRNTWMRAGAEALAPTDNPARQAHDNADAIRNSGLSIYLEAGDEDFIGLHDGAEFLHRVLWDHDIRHEYHLVRWADHVGASMLPRFREMFAFLATAMSGGRKDPIELPITAEEQALMERVGAAMAAGEMPPAEWNEYLAGPRGPTVHAQVWKPMRDMASADPDMKRAYAKLQSTSIDE